MGTCESRARAFERDVVEYQRLMRDRARLIRLMGETNDLAGWEAEFNAATERIPLGTRRVVKRLRRANARVRHKMLVGGDW